MFSSCFSCPTSIKQRDYWNYHAPVRATLWVFFLETAFLSLIEPKWIFQQPECISETTSQPKVHLPLYLSPIWLKLLSAVSSIDKKQVQKIKPAKGVADMLVRWGTKHQSLMVFSAPSWTNVKMNGTRSWGGGNWALITASHPSYD